MNYVKSFNFFGVDAKEIPCITGEGIPTVATEGDIGCFYMDSLTGDVYKCVSKTDGACVWKINVENAVTKELALLNDEVLQKEFINSIQNGMAYGGSVGSSLAVGSHATRAVFPICSYNVDVFMITKIGYQQVIRFLDENNIITQVVYNSNGFIVPKHQRVAIMIYDNVNNLPIPDEEFKNIVTIQNEETKEKKRKICGAFLDRKFNTIAYSQISSPKRTMLNTAEHYNFVGQTDGFDAIKGDIQITSDNYLVMCHDKGFTFDTNGRITTFNSSNCTPIRNMTYEQVVALEYATQYEGAYIHPADIDSLLRASKRYGKFPYITIRDENIDVIAPILIEKLREYSLETCCVINSFTLESLAIVRQYSDIVFLSQVLTENQTLYQKNIDRIDELGNVVITLFDSNGSTIEANLEMIKHAKSRGIRMFDAIFNNADNIANLVNYGFSGVQSYVPFA